MLEHFLRDLKIRYHPILERPNGSDVSRRTAEHPLGVSANRFDGFLAIVNPDRYNRRLIQHNALVAYVDQCVGGTEINRQIIGEQSAQFF